MDAARYRDLLADARRLTRSDEEAADLVQDALVIALQAGRDDPAWLAGVMRNQAALMVRGAVRRRRREQDAAEVGDEAAMIAEPTQARSEAASLLARLPPAARRVAVLALHGLAADEIRWILDLSPTAFRQRLTSIRKALGALPPEQRAQALALAYVRDPARAADLQFGLLRRALKAALLGQGGLGTHDADGHPIVIRSRAHTLPPRGNE